MNPWPMKRVKMSIKTPPFTWAVSYLFPGSAACSSCTLSFLSNKSYFIYQLTNQSAASLASSLACEGKNLNTSAQHFKLAHNTIKFNFACFVGYVLTSLKYSPFLLNRSCTSEECQQTKVTKFYKENIKQNQREDIFKERNVWKISHC
jgi:hypothetical protein